MSRSLTLDDGVRLTYRDEGAGPVVVLVAGHTGRASSWQLLRIALVSEGYRVVTIDRRHTGDSDFPPHGLRMARQGADLQEVAKKLQLQDAIWVGQSLGASALLARADLFGTREDRGLVLVDQTPCMVNDADWKLGMYGLTWDGFEAFVNRFPEGVSAFHKPPPAEVLEVLAADAGPPYPYAATRSLLRDHAASDWRDVVPRLDLPLLAIGGRHSPLWPVASTEWIGNTAPHGTVRVLEQSGHAPHLAEPDVFAGVLLSWMDQV